MSAGRSGRSAAQTELREALAVLLGAERRLRGRDQQRAEGDLSHAHVRALFALGRRGEATAGEIAAAAALSPASVTGMLDDLERAGVVTRSRSAADRRRVLVSLTEEGRGLLRRRWRRWEARWEAALAEVPAEDLAAAGRVMRRLADLLDDV